MQTSGVAVVTVKEKRDRGIIKEMLKIVVCCDVDHDIVGYNVSATRFDAYKEKLGWKNVEQNVPRARDLFNLVEDSESNNPKITWFVRSDEQLGIIFDDYAYPLRNFRNLWERLQKQGDEIGWHPHLWRWSNRNKCWYQEVSDKKWISHCLENGHKEFIKLAKNLTSVRMGWSFHNNFTMKKINDLSISVDLSAFPGIRHEGSPDERGSYFVNEYDWSITPHEPYIPSKQDYRRPAKNNEQNLSILEVPITTAPKSKRRILVEEAIRLAPTSLRRKILKGADIQFKSVQHRYVANITEASFERIAKQKFKEAKQNHKDHTNLVAIFHPIELYKQKGFQNLQNNLNAIKEFSRSSNIPFFFSTATEMTRNSSMRTLDGNL